MADPTLGEAVAGGFLALIAGIGATFKAMRGRVNSNGHGWKDAFHDLDKRVSLVERDITGIHEKVGDIKRDISAIREAVGGNN